MVYNFPNLKHYNLLAIFKLLRITAKAFNDLPCPWDLRVHITDLQCHVRALLNKNSFYKTYEITGAENKYAGNNILSLVRPLWKMTMQESINC